MPKKAGMYTDRVYISYRSKLNLFEKTLSDTILILVKLTKVKKQGW